MNYTEKTQRALPFLEGGRTTGFASPASDFEEARLDLFSRLVRNADATFFCLADSDDMHEAGIHRHDLLVVDRSLKPFHLAWIIVFHDGQRRFGRLHWLPGMAPSLHFANRKMPPVALEPADSWGVITWIIRPATY